MVIYSGLHRCDGALRSMCEHITMLVSPAPCTAQRNSVQYYAAPPSSLSSANINLACISVQAQIEEGKQQNVKSMNLLGADHILPTLACLCHALSSHAAMPGAATLLLVRGLIVSSLLQKWTERVALHTTPACHRTQLDLHGRTHHTTPWTIPFISFRFPEMALGGHKK